ncbi:hypothetical protein PA598K_03416 [Paenibacillus sp. 598K]|uniref:ABC transporter ATP-binding protein n=1 Tax=Paenibacillus sp. 598K TaxID=1117987 RepID=UPI000FFA9C6E|nr:ABC transporter ATP-binding protein [Paenibacillus sp. 598K]GBF75037.1 hypothetical protein PA598K_03416 [Paenibacillus sp. 598K]
MKDIRWMLQYVGRIKWSLLLLISILLLENVMNTVMVGVNKYIVDEIFIQGKYHLFIPIISVFVASFLLYNAFTVLSRQIRLRSEHLLTRMLSEKLMKRISRLPTATYYKENSAKYVNYFTTDINQASNTMTGYFPDAFQAATKVIILTIVIGLQNPVMVAGVFGLAFVYIALGKKLAPSLRAASLATQETNAEVQAVIEEGISSTREVLAYNRLDWERERYNRRFDRYYDKVMRECKAINRKLWLSDPLKWILHLLVIGYGGYLVIQDSLSLGSYVILYQFAWQLMDAVSQLYNALMQVPSQLGNIIRLRGMLSAEQIEDGAEALTDEIRALTFRDVTFAYEGSNRPALYRLKVDFPVGCKIGVVGGSGGGKSTLAQLLTRLYDPGDGRIEVNGTKLSDLTRESWRDRIGVVTQEVYLFPDTIWTNITLGESYRPQEVYDVSRLAHIHTFIESLPEGYETRLGERGVNLSGGQKQRLALARALLRNPDILILDEATSALDLTTERLIQQGLDDYRRGKTTILIAHRLSTIQNADHILVIQNGQLVEEGTHEQLLQHSTTYRQLVQSHSA